ncbi:hypothetical protein HDU84_006747, partial [Entophlyctis sp. JEL0112]
MFGEILAMDSESTLAFDLFANNGESLSVSRDENQSHSESFPSLDQYVEDPQHNGFVHVFNNDPRSIFEESASILDDLLYQSGNQSYAYTQNAITESVASAHGSGALFPKVGGMLAAHHGQSNEAQHAQPILEVEDWISNAVFQERMDLNTAVECSQERVDVCVQQCDSFLVDNSFASLQPTAIPSSTPSMPAHGIHIAPGQSYTAEAPLQQYHPFFQTRNSIDNVAELSILSGITHWPGCPHAQAAALQIYPHNQPYFPQMPTPPESATASRPYVQEAATIKIHMQPKQGNDLSSDVYKPQSCLNLGGTTLSDNIRRRQHQIIKVPRGMKLDTSIFADAASIAPSAEAPADTGSPSISVDPATELKHEDESASEAKQLRLSPVPPPPPPPAGDASSIASLRPSKKIGRPRKNPPSTEQEVQALLSDGGTDTSQLSVSGRSRQVKKACLACRKVCKKCDEMRPCVRCKWMDIECVDVPRKPREPRKRGPYKKTKIRSAAAALQALSSCVARADDRESSVSLDSFE